MIKIVCFIDWIGNDVVECIDCGFDIGMIIGKGWGSYEVG